MSDFESTLAVVGMSCRFPGAADTTSLWRNLVAGVESVRRFGREELLAAGVEPELLDDPRYVPAKAVVEGDDLFDAAFFGLSPREAEILDPQHRVFLETAWEALEDAAVDPSRFPGLIAVYAGVGASSYAWNVLSRNPALVRAVGTFQVAMSNDKDYLATLTSYKLDLRGPSFAVQSACSTSLVAIHLACQSLLGFECDLALAGGVTIGVPQISGYRFQEGGILSPDGHCRAFDAGARGTAPGSGAGAVVLKRFADARRDGDTVYALVRGSAVNNDGAAKVGFTAPSVAGQAEVIATAQAVAGVEAVSISYVEAHGTGTPLGDPIEVAALTQAFRDSTEECGFCGLGSIKSNFGHLDTAAGVAGFIKTALALTHRTLPPSVHFETPNPAIDFAATPFYVVDRARPWQTTALPRRAGVSSFGIGGTNAHAILEEAPPTPPAAAGRGAELVLLSARSAAALAASRERLASHLGQAPATALADLASTLASGRRPFAHRAAIVAQDLAELGAALAGGQRETTPTGEAAEHPARVVFLFPGQGAQRPGMASGLYAGEPVFRQAVDQASALLAAELGWELATLFAPQGHHHQAEAALASTRITQPALFVVENALAELLASWGLAPQLMLGHSIGEYVAAYRAGLWSLADALALVAARGRLMSTLPPGAMLSVPLGRHELAPRLSSDLAIAAVNAPRVTTVSGPVEQVARLEARLLAEGLNPRRLRTAHAFHSADCDAVLPAFREVVRRVSCQAPTLPWLSNLTGRRITTAEATDPDYWVAQLRGTVELSAGLETLAFEASTTGEGLVLLEVGPGRGLSTLARQHPSLGGAAITPCLGRAEAPESERAPQSERRQLLAAYGRAWVAGARLEVEKLWAGQERRRLHLPTYPFERQRYWVEPAAPTVARSTSPGTATGTPAGVTATASEPHGAAQTAPLHPRPALAAPYTPPVGAIEEALARLWSELLGIAPLGRHDDFFEAGGSSLLAVSLVAEIEKRFGVALSPAALADDASVAALAARLAAPRGGPSSGLVELAKTGAPCFFVHAIGGGVLAYAELARLLAPETRLVALRALGSEPDELPRSSIVAMARAYTDLIVAAEPTGPYRIGGWSFGGLVACEIARELEGRGRQVALLALLDAAPPGPTTALPADEARLRAWFERDFGGQPAGLATHERLFSVFRAHAAALSAYHPEPLTLHARVVLFAASQSGPGDDHAAAWRRLTGGDVELESLAADHYSLLTQPAVQTLATALRRHLAVNAAEPGLLRP